MSGHEEKRRSSTSSSDISIDQNYVETGFNPTSEAKIHDLARQMSNRSAVKPSDGNTLSNTLTRSTTVHTVTGVNPFDLDTDAHPELDPNSPQFNPRAWVKTLVHHHALGAGPDDVMRAGVSFRNLNVHGYGTPTDFQKNVLNVFLSIPAILGSKKGQSKIQILRDFEGVVRSGEMLVVLGRPGSGCSTFLKTIAGETHGFFIDDKSVINYQGIPGDVMHKNFRGEVVYQAETDGIVAHSLPLSSSLTLK